MITPASSKPPHPTEMQDLRSARSVLKPAEAPEGVTLLKLDSETGEPTELNAKLKRLGQLGELSHLMKEKAVQEKAAQVYRKTIEAEEKLLATPPVPAEVLKGAEAARVVALAEKQAREHNMRFPPPKDQTFVFSNKGWNYTIYGDGRVTRSKSGVLTPEQWRETDKSVREKKAVMNSIDYEGKIAALDKRITSLRDELGQTVEEELARLPETIANFSVHV